MSRMQLHCDPDSDLNSGRPVLVLLHGFTQDGRSWERVRSGLRRIGPTVVVDLPGHGRSPAPAELEPYRMEQCVEQLDNALGRLGLSDAWWVGYSMGGRLALNMAVHKPKRVRGLVLVSTTAGISDPEERAERVNADRALADRIPGWGMEAFIDHWLDQPLFAGLLRLPKPVRDKIRAQRLENDPEGLANSLRGMGAGAMLPLWPHLRDLEVPALVLAGEADEKYVILARRLASTLPEAHLSILPNTGHSAHLEQPGRFVGTVVEYFRRLE